MRSAVVQFEANYEKLESTCLCACISDSHYQNHVKNVENDKAVKIETDQDLFGTAISSESTGA